ncbi:TPA: hypothetical protein DDW35_07345 [Candidatus Sumerlaeota bacterium]|nr:hypothetical protein [Candidatus Sumerlaeota bacterium]
MNRKALSLSGAIIFIALFFLVLTVQSFAVGSIEKGDWALYQVTQQSGDEPAQSFTRKETVKDITGKEVILLHEINENGTITKREVRIALTVEYNKLQFSSLVRPKGQNMTQVGKGQESLTIKNQALLCTWEEYDVQAQHNRQNLKSTLKYWTSEKIPIGQTVRQETYAESFVDGKILPIKTTTLLKDYYLAPRVAPLQETAPAAPYRMAASDGLLPLDPMLTGEAGATPVFPISDMLTTDSLAQIPPTEKIHPDVLSQIPRQGKTSALADSLLTISEAVNDTQSQTPAPATPTPAVDMLPGGAILPAAGATTDVISYIPASSEKTYVLGELTPNKNSKTVGTTTAPGILELQFNATKLIYGQISSVLLILHIPAVAGLTATEAIRVYSGSTLLGEATPVGSTVEIPLDKDLLPHVEQLRLNVRSAEVTGMTFSSKSSGYGARLKIVSN